MNILLGKNYVRFFAISTIVLLLGACSGGTADLEAYVAQVKARPQQGIEPIPEITPYKAFTYEVGNKRNPFDASIFRATLSNKSTAKGSRSSTPAPDANRVPEFLESFPLDTLRMVGTMSQNNDIWALVQTPDDTIQRVVAGNYLGQNYGKITKVNADRIELKEIVPDGFGGWQERAASIALSD